MLCCGALCITLCCSFLHNMNTPKYTSNYSARSAPGCVFLSSARWWHHRTVNPSSRMTDSCPPADEREAVGVCRCGHSASPSRTATHGFSPRRSDYLQWQMVFLRLGIFPQDYITRQITFKGLSWSYNLDVLMEAFIGAICWKTFQMKDVKDL